MNAALLVLSIIARVIIALLFLPGIIALAWHGSLFAAGIVSALLLFLIVPPMDR